MIFPFRTVTSKDENNSLLRTLDLCLSPVPLGTSLVRTLKLPHLSGTFRGRASRVPLGAGLYRRVRTRVSRENVEVHLEGGDRRSEAKPITTTTMKRDERSNRVEETNRAGGVNCWGEPVLTEEKRTDILAPLSELTAEQAAINDCLKVEAEGALDTTLKGNKAPGLGKALLRVVALRHLIHVAQLRQACLSEARRQRRLTQIEQEQRPLGEKVEWAEAERQHALCTSDGKARLEDEAKIEEVRMQLLGLGDERRELELDENRSLSGSAISKRTDPMHRGEG
jgi:hypothetical protein